MSENLDLVNQPLINGLVVEASAGTGKTYSIAALVARELALRDDLRIGDVLITTFTRNAAAELRDRVRARLIETANQLRTGNIDANDLLAVHLWEQPDQVRSFIKRLERAAVEFDQSTISTIHSVCTKVLKAAGVDIASDGDDDLTKQIISESVNDEVVIEALAGRMWDEKLVAELVSQMLGDPFIEPWYDGDLDKKLCLQLDDLIEMLRNCVHRIHVAMQAHPSYNDLLRRAYEVVMDPDRDALVKELRNRFSLAIVDEAQDTDTLQWKFFRALFPEGDRRALIAVGDPKQAIYGFRGADVRAYVRFSQQATTQTLTTNHRSDKPILDQLNTAFSNANFGPTISYIQVSASDRHLSSQIIGVAPVEFIDVGEIGNQGQLALPAARKVLELLTSAQLNPSNPRPVNLSDICVLVRTATVGRDIERLLDSFGIRAVSNGTESVMSSATASDIRTVFEAMVRVSSIGRIRRAASTAFFGYSLRNVGSLTEDAMLLVQDQISALAAMVQSSGIAACAAAITTNDDMMAHLTKGSQGERNITDLAHVMELLHEQSNGHGCTPQQVLELFAQLVTTDEKSELVSRRVESDSDAVKIMTIHSAKGLEFPCVIVADLWKSQQSRRSRGPAVFYRGDTRVLDVGCALLQTADESAAAVREAADEETRRLIYVAVTRAKHHLCVLVPDTDNLLSGLMTVKPSLRAAATLPNMTNFKQHDSAPSAVGLQVAAMPRVRQTYRRTSFSGITAARSALIPNPHEHAGQGFDEAPRQAQNDFFPIATLPAGTAVGSIIHKIFESINTDNPLEDEVEAAVKQHATSALLRNHHESLKSMIVNAMRTPFGGMLGEVSYAAIAQKDRLSEMDFDLSLASLKAGVVASDIGKVLASMLSPTDQLFSYASELSDHSFDIPLGGLMNGSIDALLRVPGSQSNAPRLIISDYKSNKLHTNDMANPIDAYLPQRLIAAMAQHHYPLQALLYGTAIYRMLRWRLPDVDHDQCIAGVAYGFIRGMIGTHTPVDENSHRYGVFTWVPPQGLWQRLSDLLAGERP
jgi:exodeoxyribonuclease V beta subunit